MEILTKIVLLSMSCLLLGICIFAQNGDEEEMCFPFRRSSQRPAEIMRGAQGRPGKIGPEGSPGSKGFPGPQGPPGKPGQCSCNSSVTDQLNIKIQQLSKLVQGLKALLPTDFWVNNCGVGLKDRRIPDTDIRASSYAFSKSTMAAHGRLDYQGSGQWGWAAGRTTQGEWIEVDLNTGMLVTGVVTQGHGTYDQWVTAFKISFGNSTNTLQVIRDERGNDKVFSGNSDRNTYVLNRFPQPIVARYVRLVVQQWRGWPSTRLEYITC